MPLRIDDRTRRFNGCFQNVRQFGVFEPQLERTARDSRYVQEIIKEQRHVVNLSTNDIVAPASLRVGGALRL